MTGRITTVLAVVGLAVGLGGLVARVGPSIETALLAGLGVASAGLVFIRFARWGGLPHTGGTKDDFALPRASYYLGCLFIGELTLRPAFSLTLSDFFMLGSLVATLLILFVGKKDFSANLPSGVLFGALLFSVGALVSTFGSVAPTKSMLVLVKFTYLTTVWFWLGCVVLKNVEHVATALGLWVMSAAVGGLGALLQTRWSTIIPGTTPVWGRMTGFTQHVNDLGGLTGIAYVPALVFGLQPRKSRKLQLLGFTPFLLVNAGLFLSGSVGGLAAAAVSLVAWCAMRRMSVPVMLIGIVTAVAVVVLVIHSQDREFTPVTLTRISIVTAQDDPNATFWSRVSTYKAAWNVVSKDPLVGVGLDSKGAFIHAGDVVHNTVLGAWFQAGILGLLGMVVILASAGTAAIESATESKTHQEQLLTAAILAALVGSLVFAMGAPILYQRFAWMPLAALIALRNILLPAPVAGVAKQRPRSPRALRVNEGSLAR